MRIPVVTIETERGLVRLNETDYTPDMGPIVERDPPYEDAVPDDQGELGLTSDDQGAPGGAATDNVPSPGGEENGPHTGDEDGRGEDPATAMAAMVGNTAVPTSPLAATRDPNTPVDKALVLSDPANPTAGAAVTKQGTRWYVTDASGQKISARGVDANGYKKEEDAWTALLATSAPVDRAI